MHLVSFTHRGFRNLDDGTAHPAPGTTLLLGDNGQGKTSFLEAIGVLATTKSFRKARPPELVQHGSSGYSLSGVVETEEGRRELAVIVENGVRRTLVGGAEAELSEHVAVLTVVPVTAAHAGIVRGSPQERRDFLDRGILGVRPGYLSVLSTFRRTLRQKSALLRQHPPPRGDEFAAWNERLAAAGAEITLRRREYVLLLVESLVEVGPELLPANEQVALALHDGISRDTTLEAVVRAGGVPSREDVTRSLLARMEAAAPREIGAKQVLVGPHRDELSIAHGGADVRRFASSGQQRNVLLALKLAKVEVFRRRRGESPILLVDDVDTEVDPARLRTLLRRVGERSQVLMTSSKRELLGGLAEGAPCWHVERGSIRTS